MNAAVVTVSRFHMKEEQRIKLEKMCSIDYCLTSAVAHCFNVTYHPNHFLLFFNDFLNAFYGRSPRWHFENNICLYIMVDFKCCLGKLVKRQALRKVLTSPGGCNNQVSKWGEALDSLPTVEQEGCVIHWWQVPPPHPPSRPRFFCPLSIACICFFFHPLLHNICHVRGPFISTLRFT